MKIVNIVLSALILVLALVCTVFSYFLFSKRTEMVNGWNTMAASISAASTNLGKPVAKDALDFKTADAGRMTAAANGLVSQSKTVATQRDGLAADFQGIAKAVRMSEVPETTQLIADSGSVSGNDDKKTTKAIAKKVESTVRQLDSEKARSKKLGRDMKDIAKSADARRSDKKDIIAAIKKLKSEAKNANWERDQAKNQLAEERSARSKVERERDNYRRRMEAAQQERQRAKAERDELAAEYRKLTAEDPGKTKVWSNGSPEVRAKVKGTVKAVDPKNGFIVTDISTSTRVEQKIGKVTKNFDPQFKRGMELVVVREQADGKLQFIARIKINSIDETCSVANIPADAGRMIQTGDIVIDNSSYDSKSLTK